MTRPKIQFSLLAMLLFVAMLAFVLSLSFHLPNGHFALDSPRGSVGYGDIIVRMAVITPLALIQFAGLMIILRISRQRRK